jgi:hypothetical protein
LVAIVASVAIIPDVAPAPAAAPPAAAPAAAALVKTMHILLIDYNYFYFIL